MRLLALVCTLALIGAPLWAAEPAISISVDPLNTVSAQAAGVAPVFRSASTPVDAHADGTEGSECRPYGRRSTGDASAQTEVVHRGRDAISLRLSSRAAAVGGHYRTCVGCVTGNCVGVSGNDTAGKANAKSSARVTIKFDKQLPMGDYLVSLAQSSLSVAPKVALTDETGKEISLRGADGSPAKIPGGRGATYFLSVELPVVAENQGGCCETINSANARIDLDVLKAPLLSSASKLVPFIVGGKQSTTVAFPSVGALLIDGNMHCTGTLVGKTTVLTAAHCLNGYEKQIPKMTFVLGANAFLPTSGPFQVDGIAYPNGEVPGFAFNPDTYEDDIGLVYIRPGAVATRFALHVGLPSWSDIDTARTQLIFVGFGYNEIEGQQVGVGIKREVPLPIGLVENRRVAFKVNGKATCHGDSGGPAFVESSGTLFQTSVTSGADENSCTQGIQYQTRVDAFAPWLNGRIR